LGCEKGFSYHRTAFSSKVGSSVFGAFGQTPTILHLRPKCLGKYRTKQFVELFPSAERSHAYPAMFKFAG